MNNVLKRKFKAGKTIDDLVEFVSIYKKHLKSLSLEQLKASIRALEVWHSVEKLADYSPYEYISLFIQIERAEVKRRAKRKRL